jgi:drug/metabolite transporter (DMT)-like permease
MGLRVWIWLLSLSVLWGGSFFFAKVAIGELGPLTVVFARVALAALALDGVLVATATNPFRRSAPWPAYFAMGFLNNVLPFSLIFWGQAEIASGLASILNATTPLFTLVVAHFLTNDEKIGRAKVAALLAGFAGVAILIGPDLLLRGASVWGELACLGAALSYAFAGVYGRRFRIMKIAALEAAAGQVTASTVLILPIMLVVEPPWTLAVSPSMAVWAALAGLALLSTALAYVLYFRILAAAGATNLLLVTFLIPVTAVLLGAAVLGERLAPRHFGGMALIGLGLAVIDGRIGRLLWPAK